MNAEKQPPHRPSRRDEIMMAAVKVFADKGYADAAIGDIAHEANVAVTAVYYHFSGKDDLFAASMKMVLRSMSKVVLAARPSGSGLGAEGLRMAIDAVWDWVDEHPHAAALVHVHLPGATPQLAAIRHEFLELHERRASDYLSEPDSDRKATAAQSAADMLRMRVLIDSLMSVHAMRLGDGPLSHMSPAALRAEVQNLSSRMLL